VAGLLVAQFLRLRFLESENWFPASGERNVPSRKAPRQSIVVFPENRRRRGAGIKHRINAAALVFLRFLEDALEAQSLVYRRQTSKQPGSLMR
jgi:hypothetical protein